MWSALKKERFFPLDSCLLNSLSPTCSPLLEKTSKVPILAMLVWVAFQLSPISGVTVAYYYVYICISFFFFFFHSGVSLHLQTKVLSEAQAGISRCCFLWKPGDDKLQREMLFACAAVVARQADLKSVLWWMLSLCGVRTTLFGGRWYCKSHLSIVDCRWLQLSVLDWTFPAFLTFILQNCSH